MPKIFWIMMVLQVFAPGFSQAAVLLEDGGEPVGESTYKIAPTGVEMRGVRRAGVGLLAGGLSGIAGLNLEINFTQQVAINAGLGISSDFQSAFVGGKYVFGGKWFLPYATTGYARWYSPNEQGPLKETTPGFLRKKFLSRLERETGKFDENLAYVGLGLQYLQLNGDWAGTSIYFEGILIADLSGFAIAPTTTLGAMYYF